MIPLSTYIITISVFALTTTSLNSDNSEEFGDSRGLIKLQIKNPYLS
jgi:hypothetical protein